jgi:tetracycline repressor-like protein
MDDQGSLTGDIEALAARIVALVAGPLGRRIFPGLICAAAADSALLQRFGGTFVADGRNQIAQVLERSVRRGELTDARAAADLQAVLIGAALMFALLHPDLGEGHYETRSPIWLWPSSTHAGTHRNHPGRWARPANRYRPNPTWLTVMQR